MDVCDDTDTIIERTNGGGTTTGRRRIVAPTTGGTTLTDAVAIRRDIDPSARRPTGGRERLGARSAGADAPLGGAARQSRTVGGEIS